MYDSSGIDNVINHGELMNNQIFRIHGDNIIECERVVDFLAAGGNISRVATRMISAAVTEIEVLYIRGGGQSVTWVFQLFPGFNKSNRKRWNIDIFDSLRDAGGFLDETPDALITKLSDDGKSEEVLCALEFCSALQAGNQAWQRSGRAISTQRASCPYLYIVDFVKYELSKERIRKSLRMPNPAVPFSYITASKNSEKLCAQVLVRAEEFDPDDQLLIGFKDEWFAEVDLAHYIIALLTGTPTDSIEKIILEKNLKVVEFFAKDTISKKAFNALDWNDIYAGRKDIRDLALERSIPWRKKFAKSSESLNTKEFIDLCSEYAVAIGSNDLPFALIPNHRLSSFKKLLVKIFSDSVNSNVISTIDESKDLIICAVKGFKPRGDDARPDRGILPFITMLMGDSSQILTYIYGPMHQNRFNDLISNPEKIISRSGFWKVFLALSDTVIIDSPQIGSDAEYLEGIIASSNLKSRYLEQKKVKELRINSLSENPLSVHEDDVDTVIHTLFNSISKELRHEGLCNPPGGDWSGLSLKFKNREMKWLSLPRVSDSIGGKRPDHVIQLFPEDYKPLTIIVESKDRPSSLEKNIGPKLVEYLNHLVGFPPSATRHSGKAWIKNSEIVNLPASELISGAAFIRKTETLNPVYDKSKCDIMFSLKWVENKRVWQIEIINFALGKAAFSIIKNMLCNTAVTEGLEILIKESDVVNS